ncbi:carotenoid isomerase protein family [Synechococcus sp. PROS-7-1]|uniref:phytoene desaturase family protein n=1 Tax=Synechococcus sp. PROS-7-1 TaxID=1442556 RepID=UPI0016446653|nr:NAD(P)/FAD-dependent oxidoreductase [Synechococcus sp. PROS-7-1]QNI84727.1 carotenoid isomerase protein family [Synechococcus sp. PROS-7-1]
MTTKTEVIVIGSGIGGLCCAALCARAGHEVLVLEAHGAPGGAAHGFQRQGYHFESGPSLWSGLGRWPSNNPLAQILRALDEPIEVMSYRDWDVLFPEGHLRIGVGADGFEQVVQQLRGDAALEEWRRFARTLQPIAAAADALPLLALPAGGIDGLGPLFRRSGRLLPHLPALRHLSGAFGPLVDRHLTDPFLRHWVDLLCFLISGMPMADTNAAAMATLFGEWFDPEACLDFPKGGSAGVVNALVRGLQKHGGTLRLGARVKQIRLDGDRVIGVELTNGEQLDADHVVSNADAWSTAALLPENGALRWRQDRLSTPACGSFLHLHLGFDAAGLDDLPIHTVWVGDWERGITAERNAVVVSVPSVLDPGMAPAGQHVLHAYTPANEPWEHWSGLNRSTPDYDRQRTDRCGVFWHVLEQRIPDLRSRCQVVMEGTPLTHRHYLSVHNGSYGPALSAAQGLFPGVQTPVKGLLQCGASTFPGIGIPPVAASGAMAAHAITGKKAQSELLESLAL